MTDPMIVEFVRVSEGGVNWIPVWQTAIGTAGGFLFGLLAFAIQRRFQRKHDEEAKDEAVNDSLKRLLASASANMETLAMHKRQFLNAMAPEAAEIEKLVEESYRDDKRIPALVDVSATLKHFYRTVPRAYELEAPSLSELSRVADEMPGLSTFLHRAMSSMEEYNTIRTERNDLLYEHAKENAQGMNGDRVRYYASMLSGEAQGMVVTADDALAFFMLASEQVESYFDYGIKLESFTRFRMTEKGMKELPPKDRFADLRRSLVDFHEKPLKKSLG